MKPSIHQLRNRYMYLVLLLYHVLGANTRRKETNLTVCHGKEAKFEYVTDNNTPLLYIHFGEKKKELLHPYPLLMAVDENDNEHITANNSQYSERLKYEGNARAGRAVFILQNTEFNDSKKYVIYVREDNTNIIIHDNVTKLDVRDCPTNSTVDHDTDHPSMLYSTNSTVADHDDTGKKSTENGKVGNNSTYTMHPNTTAVSLSPPTPGSDVTNKSNTTTKIVLPVISSVIIIAVLLYCGIKKFRSYVVNRTMERGAHQGSGTTARFQTMLKEDKKSYLDSKDDTVYDKRPPNAPVDGIQLAL